MVNKNENQVLKTIMAEIYQKRSPLSNKYRTNCRIERVNDGLLCDLWFLTHGCSHDISGGCCMCNYGKSEDSVEWAQIVEELEALVLRLPWEFEDFLLTPSGSMLDEREITAAMRKDLKQLVSGIRTKRFIVETRADTVTASGLQFLKDIIISADKYVEIGLESSNNWILRNCVNKGFTWEQYLEAVEMIHKEGMYVTANIGVGIPFLTERMAVESAITSIRAALDFGADSVVVFPYHVKSGTLLEVLYSRGLYHCCSLWALEEILISFTDEELQKIQISWYKDYLGKAASQIIASPSTCPNCEKQILNLLDNYRNSQNRKDVKALQQESCSCKKIWKEHIASEETGLHWKSIKKLYQELAELYNIDKAILYQELSTMSDQLTDN